ncbi:similar to Saccharomyces cerevisiae YJL055W Putative protein of unknown function, proposed to be involved in the metabolism of purine and pyrimidine base analogues [Maudiozyma saulgeensis]|uniref:Cytokinin riboside 5'-monophosphate phosphoribohydrolase n=1 Tax=Maudiozyma saulgeensis TaxID=1789683 RepID=A0A1X7R3R2_9SACH|nr:similar to Saccharomyces cerevisiae YJL055W Putative protein of unknown function, proposed to be involved in the metabolism of purine and pyrimidine base analogues [Kazachstania saulgeensis]
MPNSPRSVCVYCGSSAGRNPIYSRDARELGELFHKLGWQLVYGGGTTGLMGEIAKATMGPRYDGRVHGIIPSALVSKERNSKDDDNENDTSSIKSTELEDQIKMDVDNHKGSTPISWKFGKTTVVSDMHSRKRLMADESDAFVAMPGGYGTFEEIMECITWSQLGIHNKPVILFNIDGFYDSLLEFISHSIEAGFISHSNGNIVQVATTAEEVIQKIQEYKVPEGRFNLKWDDEGKPTL